MPTAAPRLAEREYPGTHDRGGAEPETIARGYWAGAPARSVWKHRGSMEVMNVTRKSQPVTVAIVLVEVT